MTSDADPSTLVSLTSSAGDFRELIEKKLAAKRSQLGQTEETIKKYIGDRDQLPPGPARFQNRLGPPPGQASQGPLGSRLGPRVGAQPASRYRDPDDDDVTPHRVGVMSRVVVEQKTREEVLAEKRASENKSDAQRNRRMFGNLLGTLQRFRQDETRVKDRENKKKEVEKKIEEKTLKEKEEARKQKRELFFDKKKKQHEIKILEVQMKRVEEFEVWEKSKRKEMQFIRTKTGPPHIYYLPKEHTDETLNLVEETMDTVEEEIKAAKAKFEEELQKMEAKLNNYQQDPYEDDEEEEDDDDPNKPKSVVAFIKPRNRGEHKSRHPKSDDEDTPRNRDEEKDSSLDRRIIGQDIKRKVQDQETDMGQGADGSDPHTQVRSRTDEEKTGEKEKEDGSRRHVVLRHVDNAESKEVANTNEKKPEKTGDRRRRGSVDGDEATRKNRSRSRDRERLRRRSSSRGAEKDKVVRVKEEKKEKSASRFKFTEVRVKKERRVGSPERKRRRRRRRESSSSSSSSASSSDGSDSSSDDSSSDDSTSSSGEDHKKVVKIKKERE